MKWVFSVDEIKFNLIQKQCKQSKPRQQISFKTKKKLLEINIKILTRILMLLLDLTGSKTDQTKSFKAQQFECGFEGNLRSMLNFFIIDF